MNLKRSIKGYIIFICSLFILLVFGSNVNAACKVKFNDGEQFVTLVGVIENWNDSIISLEATDGSDCNSLQVSSVKVNGVDIDNPSSGFTTQSRQPGTYTIEYSYSYNEGTTPKSEKIIRYVTILDSKGTNTYPLVTTYTIASSFESEMVDSLALSNNKFVNLITNKNSSGGHDTYVVIMDALGKVLSQEKIINNLLASKLVKGENNTIYLVGNVSDGTSNVSSKVFKFDVGSDNSIANYLEYTSSLSGFECKDIYFNNFLYLVGRENNTGVIYKFEETLSIVPTRYQYSETETIFNSVYVNNSGVIYLVGEKSVTNMTSIDTNALFLKVNIDAQNNASFEDMITTGSNLDALRKLQTSFKGIVARNNEFIIVGHTKANVITLDNAQTIFNSYQGFYDGFALLVNSNSKILKAKMIGSSADDYIKDIQIIDNNKYYITGYDSNKTINKILDLEINNYSDGFEISDDSDNSNEYVINGMHSTSVGIIKYGLVKPLTNHTLKTFYYPHDIVTYNNMFMFQDNRVIGNIAPINVVKDDDVNYGNDLFKISFADATPISPLNQGDVDTSNVTSATNPPLIIKYIIDTSITNTSNIYVYNTITITANIIPPNLVNTGTGILRWHTYNRPVQYLYDAHPGRLNFVEEQFEYELESQKSIVEAIEDFINDGVLDINFKNQLTANYKSFYKASQTTAAFASIEKAKMYAIYQEFSRVVKVNRPLEETKAIIYPGHDFIGSSYYIYYIDYKGSEGQVGNCVVNINYITNCTNNGGYAFSDLNSIFETIIRFVNFNKYFVGTRNTIYNQSIPAVNISGETFFTDQLVTAQYRKEFELVNPNVQKLIINVAPKGSTETIISSQMSILTFNQTVQGEAATKNINGVEYTYYVSDTKVYINQNACYDIWFSNSGGEVGNKKTICLDTQGPNIVYKLDIEPDNKTYVYNTSPGTSIDNPLYIKSNFTLVGLDDLDPYAFVYINGNRYPAKCIVESKECEANVKEHFVKYFEYNNEKVMTMSFQDRNQNVTTLYFVIGTRAPAINVTNQEDDSFEININFAYTNVITNFKLGVVNTVCSEISQCFAVTNPASINKNIESFNSQVLNYIKYLYYIANGNGDEYINAGEIVEEDGKLIFRVSTLEGSVDYRIIEKENKQYLVRKEETEAFTFVDEDVFVVINGEENKYYIVNRGEEYIVEATRVETLVGEEVVVTYSEIDSATRINLSSDKTFKFNSSDVDSYRVIYEQVNNGEEIITRTRINYVSNEYLLGSEVFNINGVDYLYDNETKAITRRNPEWDAYGKLSLTFNRTITVSDGETPSFGVEIPAVRVRNDEENVGEIIYELITEENKLDGEVSVYRYYVTDGIYTFTIAQNQFYGTIPSVQASIHASNDSLEIKFGYLNEEGLTPNSNALFSGNVVGGISDPVDIIEFSEDSFKYPIEIDTLSAITNFSYYKDTYFMDRVAYFKFKEAINQSVVANIKVFSNSRDSFGLPKNGCGDREILIFANNVEDVNEIGTIHALPEGYSCDYDSADKFLYDDGLTSLNSLGIRKTNALTYALYGEYFYQVSIASYVYDEGQYKRSTIWETRYFYIDNTNPDNSISATINNAELNEEFVLQDGVYRVSTGRPLGTNKSVTINFDWFTQANQSKETKLLMFDATKENVGEDSINAVTCNLYHALVVSNYNKTCKDIFDSYASDGSSVTFTSSGVYRITFKDIGNKTITYEFTIDKSAPIIIGVTALENDNPLYIDSINDGQIYRVYGYLKDIVINVTASDLSGISSISYQCESNPEVTETIPGSLKSASLRIANLDVASIEYKIVRLYVWARDISGNTSYNDKVTVWFVIDNRKPVVKEEIMLNIEITPETYEIPFRYVPENSNGNGKIEVIGVTPEVTYTVTGNKFEISGEMFDIYLPHNIHPFYREGNEIKVRNDPLKSYPITGNTFTIGTQIFTLVNRLDAENWIDNDINNVIRIKTEEFNPESATCNSVDGFSFVDSNSGKKYTYILKCEDIKNETNGTYVTQNSGHFDNNVYMKFYEYDPSKQFFRGKEFNFGAPPENNAKAKFIVISFIDSAGNETDFTRVLPVIILDEVNPSLVNVKTVDNEIVNSVIYSNETILEPIERYLSMKDMVVEISEYFKTIVCEKYIDNVKQNNCGLDKYEFEYSDHKKTILFTGTTGSSITYRFHVIDFSENQSQRYTIVIDRTKPTIAFKPGIVSTTTIELNGEDNPYNSSYSFNGEYYKDVDIFDDQYNQNTAIIKFYRFISSKTYRNYTYNRTTKQFTPVADGTIKNVSINYYVRIHKSQIENENIECFAQVGQYCYVKDNHGGKGFYFDVFLNDPDYWTDKDIYSNPLTEISNKEIGVYKITYLPVDYSGNVGDTYITKTVFISDRIAPTINMLEYTSNVWNILYEDVSRNNNFTGKINKSYLFQGKETIAQNTSSVRFVTYYMSKSKYENALEACYIENITTIFDNSCSDIGSYKSTNNSYRLNITESGVHKIFVYDAGRYLEYDYTYIDKDATYHNEQDSRLFYLVGYNSDNVTIVYNKEAVIPKFTIYGNKYNDKINYMNDLAGNISYDYVFNKDKNYIDIHIEKDVSLTGLNLNSLLLETRNESVGSNPGVIAISSIYNDVVVYKETFEKVPVTSRLLLTKTYYYINGLEKITCSKTFDCNSASNRDKIYELKSVNARLVVDGNYEITITDQFTNEYQHYSRTCNYAIIESNQTDFRCKLEVNNEFTSDYARNYSPTGSNLWYAVPRRAITPSDLIYFANLKNGDLGDLKPGAHILDESFNNDLFIAFASRDKAVQYVLSLYVDANVQIYDFNGNVLTSDRNKFLSANYVIEVFAGERVLGSESVRHVPAEYTIETGKTVFKNQTIYENVSPGSNNKMDYTYSSVRGNDSDKEILVRLKIVAPGTRINFADIANKVSESGHKIEIACVSINAGGKDCKPSQGEILILENETFIYIEQEQGLYHTNYVFYGVTSYSSNMNPVVKEVGEYVELAKLHRYNSDGNEYIYDINGEYVWLDSKFISVEKELRNTERLIIEGGVEKVYVNFYSRYSCDETSCPSSTGIYYYDYKDEIFKLRSDFGIVDGFENNMITPAENKGDIPVNIKSTSIGYPTGTYTRTHQTNKIVYIELFNDIETNIASIFEIENIDGNLRSYALLKVDNEVININEYIIKYEELGVSKYKCIIPVRYVSGETKTIVVRDRAGNERELIVNVNTNRPIIEITKEEKTDSDVVVTYRKNESGVSISEIKVYLYNLENNTYVSHAIDRFASVNSNQTDSYTFKLGNNPIGIYKIEVKDVLGNSIAKEFLFNPYVQDKDLIISVPQDGKKYIHIFNENNTDAIIANGDIIYTLDSNVNYIEIYKTDSLSYFDRNISTLTPIRVEGAYQNNGITSTDLGNGKYNVKIAKEFAGVYSVKVINKYSLEVKDISSVLPNILFAPNAKIIYDATYTTNTENGSIVEFNSIELDSISPDLSKIKIFTESTNNSESISYGLDITSAVMNTNGAYRLGNNKWFMITWGGDESFSLTRLLYKLNDEQEFQEADRQEYISESRTPAYQDTDEGTYRYTFKFVDLIGNETKEFSIEYSIVPPNIMFFTKAKNSNEFSVEVKEDRKTINEEFELKCINPESGLTTKWTSCLSNGLLSFTATINGRPLMNTNGINDNTIFNSSVGFDVDSALYLRYRKAVNNDYREEYTITVVAYNPKKREIQTTRTIIIDHDPPRIELPPFKDTTSTTYKGSIEITLNTSDPNDIGYVYACDEILDEKCYVNNSGTLIHMESDSNRVYSFNSTIRAITKITDSGKFLVRAHDMYGNSSVAWYTVDNEGPTMSVYTEENDKVYSNMYTNTKLVRVEIKDKLSDANKICKVEFTPLIEGETVDSSLCMVGYTKQGKYVITPVDGVGNEGESISFIIYREKPTYSVIKPDDKKYGVSKSVSIEWSSEIKPLIAPIISITLDGDEYNVSYDIRGKKYKGEVIESIGDHLFVIRDIAGNIAYEQVTINDVSRVCIDGNILDVKDQRNYNLTSAIMGNDGYEYTIDDVLIFAIPSVSTSSSCREHNYLSYTTIDRDNSFVHITMETTVNRLNSKEFDLVKINVISKEAQELINNVNNGNVIMFIVHKDVAKDILGYKLGKSFFLEDPVGWSLIFASAILAVWPIVRIFVKKTVRVV